VKDIFFFANKDRMAGVVAAGVADDDIRLFREDVNDFAFALIAPLGANQNCIHIFQFSDRLHPPSLRYGAIRLRPARI
jgi:hypothetical protein